MNFPWTWIHWPITRLNPRMTEKVLFIVLVPWVSLESFLFLPKVVESSICRSLSHCSCLFWHFVTQNIDIKQAQARLLPSYLISKFVAWHLIKDTRYQMDTGDENHKLNFCKLFINVWFPLQKYHKGFQLLNICVLQIISCNLDLFTLI